MIGSAGVLGLMIGSMSAGKLISYGRRRAFITAIFISFGGSFLLQILNVWTLVFGRIIYGIGAAIFTVSVSRIIEETSPSQYLGAFGVFTNFSST